MMMMMASTNPPIMHIPVTGRVSRRHLRYSSTADSSRGTEMEHGGRPVMMMVSPVSDPSPDSSSMDRRRPMLGMMIPSLTRSRTVSRLPRRLMMRMDGRKRKNHRTRRMQGMRIGRIRDLESFLSSVPAPAEDEFTL